MAGRHGLTVGASIDREPRGKHQRFTAWARCNVNLASSLTVDKLSACIK